MKTYELGPFLGINNRLPDFALRVKDKGDYLRAAVNTDIDNAGRVRRRAGTTLVQAMSGAHSVWETSATSGFLVRASMLYSFSTSPTYAEVLVKALTSNASVSYVEHNGSLYYSNGVDSGRLESGVWYPWGMTSPGAPSVSTIAGTLYAGEYRVGIRYFNNVTGEAGGMSPSVVCALALPGAVRIVIPAAVPGATHVQVFVTRLNGSTLYLHSTVPLGAGTADIDSLTALTTTEDPYYAKPLPPCTRLFTHMGKLCGVSGRTLYHGIAYRLGYYEAAGGEIAFEEDIAIAVPNQFGVYVATATKTYWLAGDLANIEVVKDPLPYGATPGTEFQLEHVPLVGWFGANGFVLGDEQGQVRAPMQEAVDVVPTGAGCAGVFSSNGYRRVVSNGYCMNLENFAASTYEDFTFTSMSGGFGTKADGLYLMDGAEELDGWIGFGKVNFGAENMKQIPACYIGASSGAELELRVAVPEGQEYEYLARSYSSDMAVHRVDTGRGLRANWYGLSVYNTQGAEFVIASVSFAVVALGRRI